ncbi:hypothetical protein ARSEF1564_003596 [Beauveria bassiana]
MAHVPIMLRISAFEKAAERSSCASPSYARVFSVLNRFTESPAARPPGRDPIRDPQPPLQGLTTSPSPHLLLPHAPLLPFLAAILAISRLASASPLFVFDSTAYTNTTIGFGTSHINWIPAYVCNPLVADGALPTQQAWQRIVTPWATLQTWAAAVLPRGEGQIIGCSHALFPSAYTFSGSFDEWRERLGTVIAQSKAIDGALPVWPFVWPQYHNSPFAFYPVSLWQSQLRALEGHEDVDGFVVWGGKNHAVCNDACQRIAGEQPWLEATRSFLGELYGKLPKQRRPAARQKTWTVSAPFALCQAFHQEESQEESQVPGRGRALLARHLQG